MTPDEWRDRIGLRIERRRKSLHIDSKREAARRARFHESLWRQIESGKRQVAKGVVLTPSPEQETIEKVASVLEWPDTWLDDLMAGVDPVDVPTPATQPEAEDNETLESMMAELIQNQRATGAALSRLTTQLARIATSLGLPELPPERESVDSPPPAPQGAS